MDEQMEPRFAAALRGALLEEVRSTPRAEPAPARVTPLVSRRRRIEVAVAGLVAVAAIAAIVFGAVNVARILSAPEPAAPTLPFDGRCAGLLSTAQAGALSGTSVRLDAQPDPFDDLTAVPRGVAGVLRCAWSATAKQAVDAGIQVDVAPAAIRPEATATEESCFSSGDTVSVEQWTCGVEVVARGRWVTGFLSTPPGATKAETLRAVRALEARVRALPVAAKPAAVRTTGWWTETDCEILAERTRLAAAIDAKQFSIGPPNGGMQPAADSAAVDAIGTTRCLVGDDADASFLGVELRAWPGAAKIVDPIVHAKGWTRVRDVRGAAVYRRTERIAGVVATRIVAIDGPNVLLLAAGNDANRAPARMLAAVAPLLKDLDAHRSK